MAARGVGRDHLDDHPVAGAHGAAAHRPHERKLAPVEIKPLISQVTKVDEPLGLRIVHAGEGAHLAHPADDRMVLLADALAIIPRNLDLLRGMSRSVGDALGQGRA